MRLLEREMRKAGRTEPLAYFHAHGTRDGAPLLDELWGVIDHAEAFSTGGANSEENLVTACNKCNGRKSSASLIKWGGRVMRKPVKGKYGEPQHWDGLASTRQLDDQSNLPAGRFGEFTETGLLGGGS